MRHTPGPAAAVRNAVVSAVAKRGDPYAIRDCLAAAGIHERIELRFTIDVVARATSVDITGATFVEVIDGPGISDEAARCLEAELSGSDHVLGEGFLDGYTGRIPYIQTYAPRPAQPPPAP